MSEYVIEKGVAMPPKKGKRKYPFDLMDVGDSFAVPAESRSINRMSSAITLYCRKHDGPRFAVRHIGDELRVWRIE